MTNRIVIRPDNIEAGSYSNNPSQSFAQSGERLIKKYGLKLNDKILDITLASVEHLEEADRFGGIIRLTYNMENGGVIVQFQKTINKTKADGTDKTDEEIRTALDYQVSLLGVPAVGIVEAYEIKNEDPKQTKKGLTIKLYDKVDKASV